MPRFTLECASKLIANTFDFARRSLFLRRHLFIPPVTPDSTISFDCVIGYDAPMKQVAIFCDGSSLSNGQVAARAAAVALLGYKGIWRAVGEYLGVATNQQAEIAAAAVGLEALRQPCQVSVFTDSRYVVETMNGRFRRKANLPWWERLDKAAAAHKVHWEWTRGHAGHLLQEAADSAARRIAAAGHVEESILRDTEERIGTVEPEPPE